MNRLSKLINRCLFTRLRKTRRTATNKISSGSNLSDKQPNSAVYYSSPSISIDQQHHTTIQSPDSLFNAMPTESNTTSTSKHNNSIYQKITEITLDHSTLEQMYTDKSIFSSQILDQNLDMTSSDRSFTSFDQAAPTDIALFTNNIRDSPVKLLHEQIRFRLAALKYIANSQLNIPTPVNISMLDKIYDMKLQALNQEATKQLSKYDKSSRVFFSAFSCKLKGLRHRSKSVDKLHCNKKLNQRCTIERQFEAMVHSMQLEIMSSICELEVYYGQLLALQHEQMEQQSSSRKQRPASKYLTENALRKRIRKRHNKHHSCSSRSVGSVSSKRSSSEEGDSRRSSVSFESSVIIPERYKNACAEETSV